MSMVLSDDMPCPFPRPTNDPVVEAQFARELIRMPITACPSNPVLGDIYRDASGYHVLTPTGWCNFGVESGT